MKILWATLGVAILAGCSTLKKDEVKDSRGYVMDHQSTVDRGGVGNYLFRNNYGDADRTAMTDDEQNWDTTQSAAHYRPQAELAGDNIEISDEIRFRLGSAHLTENSMRILDDVAAIIIDNGNNLRAVEVSGHTDFTGSDQRNRTLSELRAQSVRRYLISQGVPENKLVAVGYSNQDPKFDPQTSSPDELAQNRRVEFKTEVNSVAE